jgi:heme A synthase
VSNGSPLRRASLGTSPVNGGGKSFAYLRLQARRRRRSIAPAGWLAISLIAASCLGLFTADRTASLVCAAMGPRCVVAQAPPSLSMAGFNPAIQLRAA